MVTVSSNPNHTNPAYPTNPTTKYRSEFVNLFCIYAEKSANPRHGCSLPSCYDVLWWTV